MSRQTAAKKSCKGCKNEHTTENICCGDHPETCHNCQDVRQNWALGFGVLLLMLLVLGIVCVH